MSQLANIPRPVALFIPTLHALKNLGGSGSIEEITNEILRVLNLSDEVLNVLHGNTSQSELEYRSSWSRTYLKKYGLIENSARGVWALTSMSIDLDDIDPKEIVRVVKGQSANSNTKEDFADIDNANELVASVEHLEEIAWHQKLHKHGIKSFIMYCFRLVQTHLSDLPKDCYESQDSFRYR